MYYGKFLKSIRGTAAQVRSFGHIIEQASNGKIIIDGEKTSFTDLEEARQYQELLSAEQVPPMT